MNSLNFISNFSKNLIEGEQTKENNQSENGFFSNISQKAQSLFSSLSFDQKKIQKEITIENQSVDSVEFLVNECLEIREKSPTAAMALVKKFSINYLKKIMARIV